MILAVEIEMILAVETGYRDYISSIDKIYK